MGQSLSEIEQWQPNIFPNLPVKKLVQYQPYGLSITLQLDIFLQFGVNCLLCKVCLPLYSHPL
jgi:hypothetical protein